MTYRRSESEASIEGRVSEDYYDHITDGTTSLQPMMHQV
jgi:hypothetical protein